MIDVPRLRLLVELSRLGTISAVAASLSYSRAAVSEQLSTLARETGVQLLERAGRGVALTPQAEVLVAHGIEILDRLEDAEVAVAQSVREACGTIRVSMLQSAAISLLPQAVRALAASHPLLRVEAVEREPEHGLFGVVSREIDMALAEEYPGRMRIPRREFDRVPLVSDELFLAVAPEDPVYDDPVRTLVGTRDRPWVMEPTGTVTREWSEQACRTAGFQPDVRFETADLMTHIRLIHAGAAVGILPALITAGAPAPVRLSPLPGRPRRQVFSSARIISAGSPAVRAVREALSDVTQGLDLSPPER